ncbi:MAG: transcriptional regulator [Rhodobacteraceae bacterium]|jgi:hypothetical protein|nr:transcriptional regulator [Paracoccaceae bacterium]
MPRKKILSDDAVLIEARRLHAEGGDKALTFGALSLATGLAASTLSQRFGTVEGLAAAAARSGWLALIETADAEGSRTANKGPQGYLKALEATGAAMAPRLLELGRRDGAAMALAADWRGRVETTLALRLGQRERARTAAQAIFVAWQGQILWQGEGPKIKDLAKRLI